MNTFDNIETPFASSITRGPVPRWQRKLLESTLTPKKGSASPQVRYAWIPNVASCKLTLALQGDRFIPNRSAMNLEACQFSLAAESTEQGELMSSPKAEYQRSVKNLLMGDTQSKILSFKGKAPLPSEDAQSELRVLYTQNKTEVAAKKSSRFISQTPDRVLDAPEMRPDFYLNLVDWSSTNTVAVALGDVCSASFLLDDDGF